MELKPHSEGERSLERKRASMQEMTVGEVKSNGRPYLLEPPLHVGAHLQTFLSPSSLGFGWRRSLRGVHTVAVDVPLEDINRKGRRHEPQAHVRPTTSSRDGSANHRAR